MGNRIERPGTGSTAEAVIQAEKDWPGWQVWADASRLGATWYARRHDQRSGTLAAASVGGLRDRVARWVLETPSAVLPEEELRALRHFWGDRYGMDWVDGVFGALGRHEGAQLLQSRTAAGLVPLMEEDGRAQEGV
ncbi:MAG TPA: hypothetical protein VGS19_29110 [Streptosporangiaceae bacterium]|nr:hypothetical protein [Streptosporangiaceae bacterium]